MGNSIHLRVGCANPSNLPVAVEGGMTASSEAELLMSFTPTMNSLEVRCHGFCNKSGGASRQQRVETCSTITDCASTSDPIMHIQARQMATYLVRCPLAEAPSPLSVRVKLIRPEPSHRAGQRAASQPADSESDSDMEDGLSEPRGHDELNLTDAAPKGDFHFLPAGSSYSVIVWTRPESNTGSCPHEQWTPHNVVTVGAGMLGLISGPPTTGKWPVEVISNASASTRQVSESGCKIIARNASLVFNTRTLHGLGLSGKVSRNLILPRDELGSWLLGLSGNYAYAASYDLDFTVRLFEHGLFVLPGDSQIFACPLPLTPFVFKLQESKNAPGKRSWRSCKMLKRYGKQFQMSCNHNFKAHLQLCAEYHTRQGGTWICDKLIDILMQIHKDPRNKIRMYAFELWDKADGKLVAASFGFALGTFFHDFSMCCLVKDCRSSGAILTKAIGSLLTDCGITDWYWGCKMGYMVEYEKHGAMEISRTEYYERIRRAIGQELSMDPSDAIGEGAAPVEGCKSRGIL